MFGNLPPVAAAVSQSSPVQSSDAKTRDSSPHFVTSVVESLPTVNQASFSFEEWLIIFNNFITHANDLSWPCSRPTVFRTFTPRAGEPGRFFETFRTDKVLVDVAWLRGVVLFRLVTFFLVFHNGDGAGWNRPAKYEPLSLSFDLTGRVVRGGAAS